MWRFLTRRKESSSSSGGWKDRAGKIAPLAAGIALTALGVLLARQRISRVEEDIRNRISPVDVVVAGVPIAPGVVLTRENLARQGIASSGTSSRNVPAREFDLLLGARSKVALAAGEPVLWTDVEDPLDDDGFSKTIPPGRRAMTIEADAGSAFAGLLRPGDRVDLFCAGTPEKPSSAWFFDMPVIAVDRRFGPSPGPGESPEASSITLSVTPDDARRLSAARDGVIRWFLRNPEDRGRPAGLRGSPDRFAQAVEIWKGGLRQWPAPPVASPVGRE